MNGEEYKLTQFADDLTMFLHFDRQTLMEISEAFDRFQEETDFKVNYDKTSLYRVGSLRNSNAKIYTGKPFKWTNSPPVVLGIQVENLEQNNFSDELKKAEQVCQIWQVRSLSLMGKIVILNTLISSLFVYKMNVLRKISSEEIQKFERLTNDFLWGKGKRPKIAIHKLYNLKEWGGLKLVNLQCKDIALKIEWVYKFKTNNKIRGLALEFLPQIGEGFWFCNLEPRDVKKVVVHSFWQCVAEAWAEINFEKPKNRVQVLHQVIWFNSCIKIRNQTVFFEKMHRAGISTINDICVGNRVMNYAELTSKFGDCVTIMEFNGLVSAIPQEWKRILKIPYVDNSFQTRFECVKPKASRMNYASLVEDQSALDPLRSKWENKLGETIEEEEFEKLFVDLYKYCPNPKLRSFQFRFLHRRIFLNRILFQWKLTESALCFYCSEDYETIEHLFLECKVVKRFWELLQSWFECLTDTEITLTKKAILFNNTQDITVNAVLVCAKQFIFSRRTQEKYINFYIFKDHLRQLIKFEREWEKKINTKTGWKKFSKKWGKIIRI